MPYSNKFINLQLLLAWFLYFFLIIAALITDVHAADKIRKSEIKVPFAKEIVLSDGKVLWLHGQTKGSFVTSNGKAASSGLYSSKDGKVAFTVDGLGYLTAAVTDLDERTEHSKSDVATTPAIK